MKKLLLTALFSVFVCSLAIASQPAASAPATPDRQTKLRQAEQLIQGKIDKLQDKVSAGTATDREQAKLTGLQAVMAAGKQLKAGLPAKSAA